MFKFLTKSNVYVKAFRTLTIDSSFLLNTNEVLKTSWLNKKYSIRNCSS